MMPQGAPPAMPQQKAGGLAITALILSCLFFLPIIPLVGGILGIIAVATAPPGRPKGAAIVAIVLGFTLGLGGGCMAAIAIPSFTRYIKRSKSAEARMNVQSLYHGAVAYYESEQLGSDGKVRTHVFPATTDWTPAEGACGYPGGKIPPDPTPWRKPTWEALHFTVDAPSFYQYRFSVVIGDGSHPGDEAMVEARGDLDCDGIFSSYVRHLVVGPGQTIQAGDLVIEREDE